MRARQFLPLAVALLLSACGATATPSPSPSAEAHGGHDAGAGGSGTPHPSVPEGADGSIELVSDFAFGGSGVSVAEALEVASTEPVLVTGILLRDPDDAIWFCDALDGDADPPACGAPRLQVANLTEDAVFDPANADSSGARTEGGVTWVPEHQLFGVVHPAP